MNDFPGSSDDERMRQLLDDAVSDVEPRDSLDSIRARTKVKDMSVRRNWLFGAGAAVVATAATITAVAVMGGGPGTTGAQDPGFAGTESPTASSKPSTEPTSSTDGGPGPEPTTFTVPVYYVAETSRGPRLYREFHVVETAAGKPQAALIEAMTRSPVDPDYRTDWPAGTSANSVAKQGDIITVDLDALGADLHGRPDGMTEQEASLAVQQLMYTAQAALQDATRSAVQFLINGERTDTVLGVPTSEPLAEGDPTEVLAQVWIIEPAEGAEVQSPFTVSGLANAFEANVQWELMQGDAVVDRGFTTARECCTMAPYSFKVSAPPGDYTLVVHDSDPSDGEGFAPWQDTKNITVTE